MKKRKKTEGYTREELKLNWQTFKIREIPDIMSYYSQYDSEINLPDNQLFTKYFNTTT